jgi:ribokinase
VGAPRIVVIGHVEWVTFAYGQHPSRGEIAHLRDPYSLAGGGAVVTAVELARLGAQVTFLTVLGVGDAADRCQHLLEQEGIAVHARRDDVEQTRVLTVIDDREGERTILVIGDNLHVLATDDLPWSALEACDAAYFTGTDPAALVRARRAPRLVVTARRLATLARSGVAPDVLVGSASDPAERFQPDDLDPRPGATVITEGALGGRYAGGDGPWCRWAPAPLPGPPVDSYGAGDRFLAGLTFALASGATLARSVDAGAVSGAAAAACRGPYTLRS